MQRTLTTQKCARESEMYIIYPSKIKINGFEMGGNGQTFTYIFSIIDNN